MSKSISNNEFDSLDEFFSDKLKDTSMSPPEKVWQQIEGSLNKERKRKRRFLWIFFSGMFLISITVITYFTVFDTKESNTSYTAKVKNTTIVAKPTVTNPTPLNSHIESKEQTKKAISENTPKEENNKTVKIQLGAFKKQKAQTYFSKLNLDVKSENIANGITRYYAEVPESKVRQTLELIKQNGFSDAFIKDEILPVNNVGLLASNKNVAVKKESTLSPLRNNQEKSVVVTTQNQPETNSMAVGNTKEKIQQTDKIPSSSSGKETITSTVAANSSQQNQSGDSISSKNVNLTPIQTNSISETSSTPIDNVALTDSEKKDSIQTEIASTKKDSAIIKPDSVKIINQVATADSSNKATPVLNRWALLLTGGPNFLLKNTQSNLFTTAGEKQPYTYNASLKLEFKPFKRVAFSAGISYNYFIAQQDATLFYFNRYLTSDYIFYSSFGPMAVDKNIMLQGFSPLAPATITMFHANYSYTSKINTLLIPVQAKYYYLNTKRINLFADMGFSGMVVLSQRTNLSVIKESVVNNLSYNQITTTKFNGLLMLGLGGDIRLYKQLYFTIDGGFRYGLNNLSSTTGIKTIPAYFSANGGIKIKL